jgi:hypothetical protein
MAADSIRFNAGPDAPEWVGRENFAQSKSACKHGHGARSAVAGNHILAIPLDCCTVSGFWVIQVAQEQFADWRIAQMH